VPRPDAGGPVLEVPEADHHQPDHDRRVTAERERPIDPEPHRAGRRLSGAGLRLAHDRGCPVLELCDRDRPHPTGTRTIGSPVR